MKKIPLDPEHKARQKKIRKMLAAGLPLAALMSGLSGCDEGPRVRMLGMPPDDLEDRPVQRIEEPPRVEMSGVMLSPDERGKIREQIPEVHVVKTGDTLESIARQYGTTVANLKELNGLTGKQADLIKPGQEIKLK